MRVPPRSPGLLHPHRRLGFHGAAAIGPVITRPLNGQETDISHALLAAAPWPIITNVVIYAAPAPNPGGGGSATMIGGYTGIGCAHSFYNRTTQQWYSAHNWAVSRVQTTNYLSSPPTTTTSGSPVYSQCFTVTIPASYTTGNNEGDFAILDFAGCGLYPGYSYGWMWPAYSTSISAYNGTVHGLIAYDQNDAPPQPHGLSNWYSTPTLIDRGARPAGTMWIDNFNHWRFMYTMSVTGGSSGGGVAGYLFGTSGALYWLGNNAWSDVATGANGGRVLTPGSWGFIQAYSQEY